MCIKLIILKRVQRFVSSLAVEIGCIKVRIIVSPSCLEIYLGRAYILMKIFLLSGMGIDQRLLMELKGKSMCGRGEEMEP
jgi:hypothetical protein